MNAPPQIDDRRRFRELWKELLLARFAAAAAAGLAYAIIREGLGGAIGLGVLFLLLALPSAAAKRGRWVLPAVAAAVMAGALSAYIGTTRLTRDFDELLVITATIGAAMGVVEGTFEKSVATIYAGLIGGALAGAAAWVADDVIVSAVRAHIEQQCGLVAVFVTIHLGIALSLALGRWIRDWPKRSATA